MKAPTSRTLFPIALLLPLATAFPSQLVSARIIERVSVASDGSCATGDSSQASISADGRFVAFESLASNLVPGDTNGTWDVFVHDRATGRTERISIASDGTQGNGQSESLSISANGRFVAFNSWASNLVPGDTNGWPDIFVHDRAAGRTERVSVAADGSQSIVDSLGGCISANGRFVAFESGAFNLVPGRTPPPAQTDIFVASNDLAGSPPGPEVSDQPG
jgi:Tol biopolymer transport system component